MAYGHRAPSGSGAAPPAASPCRYIQQKPTAACASDAAAPITGGLGAVGHQQAAPGIYRGIVCTTIRVYKKELNIVRIGGILCWNQFDKSECAKEKMTWQKHTINQALNLKDAMN